MLKQIKNKESSYLSIYRERLYSIRLKYEYPEVYDASLKQNSNKVDWSWISSNQTLSEKFIIEFKDRVDWYWISANQTLSAKFIKEFDLQ